MRLHTPTRTLAGLALLTAPLVAACGDGNESTSTTSPASATTPVTTAAPTTESPVSTTPATVDIKANPESLSYLLQRLLTTSEIGNGWIDRGRNLVPPQQDNLRAGGLCGAGEEMLPAIGNRLNDLVMTSYRKDETPPTGSITESLVWGPRTEIEADFTALKAATEACIGTTYVTPNGDSQQLSALDVPSMGTDSIATHLAPGEPITENPWMEVDSITILLTDPSADIAVVVTVSYLTVHEPGQAAVAPDVAELVRVAQLAVDKNMSPP